MIFLSAFTTVLFATIASGQSCIDETKKFPVRQNLKGEGVFRSCEWAKRENTQERCQIENVLQNCPGLCDPSCPCNDAREKFGIKDLKADLLCKDGQNNSGKPKKRFCNIKKFAALCPETCKIKGKNKKDKIGTIRTTVPSFKVSCDADVKSWYRSSTYCDNFKFKYLCPQKCNTCPEDFLQPSSQPSLSSSPTSSPKPTFVVCEEDRRKRFEIMPGGGNYKSCEWAASNTTKRCAMPKVFENCPSTCNPVCTCAQDSQDPFGLKKVKAGLLCEDGKKANGKVVPKFCNIEKFNYLCTPTCEPDSPCAKQGTCVDKDPKNGVIITRIPTLMVKCGHKPKEWYTGTKNSYCDQPKYRYYCPNECESCPIKKVTTSPVPSTTVLPSSQPSTNLPSSEPSERPSSSILPSNIPSISNAPSTSVAPSAVPSISFAPSTSMLPSIVPSGSPSNAPSGLPSTLPSTLPSVKPSSHPSNEPSSQPSNEPSSRPSNVPSIIPSEEPSRSPIVPTP